MKFARLFWGPLLQYLGRSSFRFSWPKGVAASHAWSIVVPCQVAFVEFCQCMSIYLYAPVAQEIGISLATLILIFVVYKNHFGWVSLCWITVFRGGSGQISSIEGWGSCQHMQMGLGSTFHLPDFRPAEAESGGVPACQRCCQRGFWGIVILPLGMEKLQIIKKTYLPRMILIENDWILEIPIET